MNSKKTLIRFNNKNMNEKLANHKLLPYIFFFKIMPKIENALKYNLNIISFRFR